MLCRVAHQLGQNESQLPPHHRPVPAATGLLQSTQPTRLHSTAYPEASAKAAAQRWWPPVSGQWENVRSHIDASVVVVVVNDRLLGVEQAKTRRGGRDPGAGDAGGRCDLDEFRCGTRRGAAQRCE